MEPEQEINQKGAPKVQNTPFPHMGADSETSVETTHEDPEARAIIRRLLWKLDTRCVFVFGIREARSY